MLVIVMNYQRRRQTEFFQMQNYYFFGKSASVFRQKIAKCVLICKNKEKICQKRLILQPWNYKNKKNMLYNIFFKEKFCHIAKKQ